MRPLPSALFATALATLAFGCKKERPPEPSESSEASRLPPITIKADAKLLLTYFDSQQRSFASATRIEDVPESDRGWVRVVDLSAPPQARRDHALIYVGDLRQANKDGSYPYVVMSRSAFELAARNRARSGATAATSAKATDSRPPVILYETSWCPACRKARSWLEQQGIAFARRDIEKDPAAAAELMRKAQQAGISPSGVPVLDIRGKLLQGFSPARVKELLAL